MIIIPYITKEVGREKEFTQEMENATIFCFSELKRKKQSFLRESSEKIECIAKLGYPLQIVPYNKKAMLIDMLGQASTTIFYNQIPSVLKFTEDLKRSNTSLNLFKKTLYENEKMFADFLSVDKVELKALISGSLVPNSFLSFINQVKYSEENQDSTIPLVSDVYGTVDVESVVADFLHEEQRVQTDIEGMKYALQVLREETIYHKEKILIETELIEKDYENKIFNEKKVVDKKVVQLEKEKIRELCRAEKRFDGELKRLEDEKKRLDHKVNELRHTLTNVLAKKRIQKHNYPKLKTTRIDNRISLLKETIRKSNLELNQVINAQEKIRIQKRQEIDQTNERYAQLIEKEVNKIKILERSRDLEITKNVEEMTKFNSISHDIETQINDLINKKVKDLEALNNLLLNFSADKSLLILIPFYIVQYRLGNKARIDLYPPMVASKYEGILKKIQKTISFSLEAKMQVLLSPLQSNLNEVIFSKLQKTLKTDLSIKEKIMKNAFSSNLLSQPSFKDYVSKGLNDLESEGWMTKKEKETLLNALM